MIRVLCYLCVCSIYVCVSCNKDKVKNGKTNLESKAQVEKIVIDLDKNTYLSLDSLINKTEFVKLETRDDNLTGGISHVFFEDSLLIVVDSEYAKAIYVFDTNGKFKHPIGKKGNGPEEFVEISNVCIMPDKKILCILDRPQKKILYFDIKGNFISSERFPFTLNYYEYIDSNHKVINVISMFDYNYGKYRGKSLLVTDSANYIKYGMFEDSYNNDFYYVINRPLRKFGQTVFFSPNLTDSIYIIEKNKVIPKYHIELRSNKMPEFEKKNMTSHKLTEYMNRYFFFNGDFVELQNYTFINIATPWGYPFAIYSHWHKETFLTSGEFSNPLHPFIINNTPIGRYRENGVVFQINANDLISAKKGLYKRKNYREMLDVLFDDLFYDSNPILFIYHINIRK